MVTSFATGLPNAAASGTGTLAGEVCFRASDPANCTATIPGGSLTDPFLIAASPDGKSIYVADASANALASFSRNLTTGVLTQQSNVSALASTFDVVVSPNNFVYVANTSNVISAFIGNASSGALTALPTSPISDTGGPQGIGAHPSGRFLWPLWIKLYDARPGRRALVLYLPDP